MRTAYIPPIPHLRDFGHGDFHLILSHLLDDPDYMEHYKAERAQGAWLLLDNSAHENGEGADAEKLMYQALSMQVQEVVVPDALDHADNTLERSIEALGCWNELASEHHLYDLISKMRFMYVPQGENYDRLVYCLDNLVKAHVYNARQTGYRLDFSIGISKDYERFPGGLMRFLDQEIKPMHLAFARNGVDIQIHMLGWGRDLWALKEISAKHPYLRSTDSAKPFVYALDNIQLDASKPAPIYPTRPENYFYSEMSSLQAQIANINCSVFTACASGELAVV